MSIGFLFFAIFFGGDEVFFQDPPKKKGNPPVVLIELPPKNSIVGKNRSHHVFFEVNPALVRWKDEMLELKSVLIHLLCQ